MAISISVEIDSLLVWVFIGLQQLKISPEVFGEEFASWIIELRNTDFANLGDRAHFDNDLLHQSVAFRGESFDRGAAARSVLKRLKEIEDGDT